MRNLFRKIILLFLPILYSSCLVLSSNNQMYDVYGKFKYDGSLLAPVTILFIDDFKIHHSGTVDYEQQGNIPQYLSWTLKEISQKVGERYCFQDFNVYIGKIPPKVTPNDYLVIIKESTSVQPETSKNLHLVFTIFTLGLFPYWASYDHTYTVTLADKKSKVLRTWEYKDEKTYITHLLLAFIGPYTYNRKIDQGIWDRILTDLYDSKLIPKSGQRVEQVY